MSSNLIVWVIFLNQTDIVVRKGSASNIFCSVTVCNVTNSVFAFIFRPAPKNEVEIMIAIFEAIDRIFNIVRPRRILYMAIDGVVSILFYVMRKQNIFPRNTSPRFS